MQRLNKIIAWIGLIALGLPALAQETHQFTIQQAIDYAKKNNLQVKNTLLNIQLQRQQNREITAAAYPQLSGSVSGTYNPYVATQVIPNFISPSVYQVLIDQSVKDGSGNPITMPNDFGNIAAQFGTKFNASAGVDLSQLLFDGQVFIGLKARSTSIAYQEKYAEVTDETIRSNIYKVYYQLLVGRTQIALLDENIARIAKLAHDTRELYKNGFAEQLDVNKVEVQSANLNTEKLKALNNIATGYTGLKVLMGMPVKDSLVLTDTLDENQIKEGILALGDYNYKDRKDYQYAELGKKLNEFNVKRYQLSQIPTFSLSGNYYKSAQRNKFDFFGKGDWYNISAISVRMSVPIFRGFATKARIEQARIQLLQTQNQLDNLKNQIDQEAMNAKANFAVAVTTLDYQKKNMELAETVYEQTKKKYEIGTGSNTEITTAQADLKQAQTNYIGAVYDAIIAKIDYLKATGKL
ncbi:MAG TPA: TolC family protein [Chitinophagaceae bacterium]|nr:TolC family protein [Chitinophagaceae bacterium]